MQEASLGVSLFPDVRRREWARLVSPHRAQHMQVAGTGAAHSARWIPSTKSSTVALASPRTLVANAGDRYRCRGRSRHERLARSSPELLILRELEGLSYREMAEMKGIPMGTVMSGLSRARQQFRSAVTNQPDRRSSREVFQALRT